MENLGLLDSKVYPVLWVNLDPQVLQVPLDLLARARLLLSKFPEGQACQDLQGQEGVWVRLDLPAKEVLRVTEVQKVQPVCQVFLEALEVQVDQDPRVKGEHLVYPAKTENLEENIARMISVKFAHLSLETG